MGDTIKDNVNRWIKNTVDDKQYEELVLTI